MLELQSVQIAYGAIEAVRGVSLRVDKGEIVAIIGANGAGKSSLLKSIVGLEPLRAGQVWFNGEDISGVPAHRRLSKGIALSPEGRGVFPDQSVHDNLLLGGYGSRASPDNVADAIEQGYTMFPRLRERREQLAGTMSGGEQQMLAIARALVSRPQLLLLDEPSLGLAPLIVRDIFKSIVQLRELGLTIVLVEQMANQALAIADRAYVLETGAVTVEGTGKELLNAPEVRAAYLGVH